MNERLVVEETLENPIGLQTAVISAAEWVPKVQDGMMVFDRRLSNLSGKKTELMVMR